MMKTLLINWKTTSAGLTMIATSTIHLVFQIRAHEANENSWTIAILAILGGLGLMFAGDANKSATTTDLEHVQKQIKEVPGAITSGDTTMLTKAMAKDPNAPTDPKPPTPTA